MVVILMKNRSNCVIPTQNALRFKINTLPLNRLFLFERDKTCNEHILAVPATGEEIYFEIYGVDTDGNILPLVKREL